MENLEIETIWLIGGLTLILLELLLPGGIVFFLGLAALIVSALLYAGLIGGWIQAFTVWFIASLTLLFALRGIVQKIIPAQIERAKTNQDLDAYGDIVEVRECIPVGGEGRIRFRDSTWRARNYRDDQDLEAGTKVRLIFRENLVWIVEAVDTDTHPKPTDSNDK